MIPYPYEMVDMGGIDLAEANHTVVEGLYAKITEAVNACGDVVLYNWKFAGIEIAPYHAEILLGDPIVINGAVEVTELDEVTVPGLPPPVVPVEPLEVSENGVYSAEEPLAGFNPVTVNVNSVIESNVPPTDDLGVDGDFYLYNAPAPEVILGITITKAARGSDYSFTYWGARDIQIIFEDSNGNEVWIKDIQGASCYWAAASGNFSRSDDVINGVISSSYYEHYNLPGYWEFVLPSSVIGYKVVGLKIAPRSGALKDFYRDFTFSVWSEPKEETTGILAVTDSVQSDWDFSGYTNFTFPPVELTGTIPYFYKKVNGEWILVK